MNFKYLILILPILLIFSCKKEETPPEDNQNNNLDTISLPQYTYDTTYCNVISSPDTVSINDTIQIEVSFTVYDTCGELSQFLVSGSNVNQFIQIEAKYDNYMYCQYVPTTVYTTYKYKPIDLGFHSFTFNGFSSDSTVTVIVD